MWPLRLPVCVLLQLAVSSDKMASLQIPLLSLGLGVKENGVLRPVAMEMDREELNVLLASLDAANKVKSHLRNEGCLHLSTASPGRPSRRFCFCSGQIENGLHSHSHSTLLWKTQRRSVVPRPEDRSEARLYSLLAASAFRETCHRGLTQDGGSVARWPPFCPRPVGAARARRRPVVLRLPPHAPGCHSHDSPLSAALGSEWTRFFPVADFLSHTAANYSNVLSPLARGCCLLASRGFGNSSLKFVAFSFKTAENRCLFICDGRMFSDKMVKLAVARRRPIMTR